MKWSFFHNCAQIYTASNIDERYIHYAPSHQITFMMERITSRANDFLSIALLSIEQAFCDGIPKWYEFLQCTQITITREPWDEWRPGISWKHIRLCQTANVMMIQIVFSTFAIECLDWAECKSKKLFFEAYCRGTRCTY